MHSEEAFLSRLADHPDDDVTRLVYADWLDERGDARAAYLRAEVALAGLGPDHPEYAEARDRLIEARGDLCPEWLVRSGRAYDLLVCLHPWQWREGFMRVVEKLS